MVSEAGVVVWDVDGTLIPADLRWLRRAVARTYGLPEAAVVFPASRVHGYTDESIVVDTAQSSGVAADVAEAGIPRFHEVLSEVMTEGSDEFAQEQPAYPGAAESIAALHREGFVQTVLTGNLRFAAEFKLRVAGLDTHVDFSVGGFGSDARDRFALPEVIGRRFAARYGHPPDPNRTVVIGDAANDVACARYAGFRAVVVAHRVSRGELEQLHPDKVLNGLDADEVVATVKALVAQPPGPAQ